MSMACGSCECERAAGLEWGASAGEVLALLLAAGLEVRRFSMEKLLAFLAVDAGVLLALVLANELLLLAGPCCSLTKNERSSACFSTIQKDCCFALIRNDNNNNNNNNNNDDDSSAV